MTTSMIERVARAMGSHLDQKQNGGGDYVCLDGGGYVTLDGQFDLVMLARAAIEAMREPTDAMAYAAQRFMESEVGSSATLQACAYSAMIDAALSEEAK